MAVDLNRPASTAGAPAAARDVTLEAVFAARRRIAPYVRRTPLIASAFLSARAGGPVSLKLESLQITNSFKARGALNAALSLREMDATSAAASAAGASRAASAASAGLNAASEPRRRAFRLVTASSGNHGRALSHAARLLGFACTVFAPANTPRTKLEAIRANGADLITTARDYDEAEAAAKAFAAASIATAPIAVVSSAVTAAAAAAAWSDAIAVYVSPYNDPRIVAATGTIALELFEDQPDLDTIVVPLGGGGLIGGIATAAKAIKPGVRVIGVEAAANPAFHTTRRHGAVTPIAVEPTLADGLGGNIDPASLTLDLVSHLVDEIVLVEEADIARTIRDLAVHDRIIAEGAAAVASAAISVGSISARAAGRDASGGTSAPGPIAVIVTGSNIDGDRLSSLMSAS